MNLGKLETELFHNLLFDRGHLCPGSASRLSEVVSALGLQPSDPGSIPGPRLVDRECDDNALKALLREPPCRTCKNDQAGIKVQDY